METYARRHGLSDDQKAKLIGRVVENRQDLLPS
jgi:hypothetical protein